MNLELRKKIEEAAKRCDEPLATGIFLAGAEFALSLKPEPGSDEDDLRDAQKHLNGLVGPTSLAPLRSNRSFVFDAFLAGRRSCACRRKQQQTKGET